MRSLTQAGAVAAVTFGASLLGMALQWVVPADVLTASKGSVGAMVGLVTLLLALVLGLLVFTAFSVFTTQRDEAYSLGPLVAEVDLALEQYGPEAAGGRAGMYAALQRSRLRFFGDSERGPQPFTFEEMRAIFSSQSGFFDRLKPATDAQRALVATAKDQVRKLADTQMLMARQLASPFPPHVLNVVVCWAAALFLGNGLVAAPNAVSVLAHLAGAISIGIAIFLILELSSPYTGLIRLSPAGIDRVFRSWATTRGRERPPNRAAAHKRNPGARLSSWRTSRSNEICRSSNPPALMDEIERLELQIEELREAIERSRRFALAGRASVVAGPALLVAILIGLVAFTPARTVFALALAIGGMVLSGSSRATTEELRRALTRVEAERNAAIDGLELVDRGDGTG